MKPATFFASVTRVEELPSYDKPQIAMVGRSNAGKSTLVNHLTGQKNLARVSAAPGRTRTINLYDIGRYFLVDLPGYGFAKGSKDTEGDLGDIINNYLERTPQIRLVMLIISAQQGLTELDRTMLEFLQGAQASFVIIANKVDKLSKSELASLTQKLTNEFPDVKVIPHSSETGKYRGEILETIEVALRATRNTGD